MRNLVFIILLAITPFLAKAQQLDSLWSVYNSLVSADTTKVKAAFELSNFYYYSNPDTTVYLCEEALKLSESTQFKYGLSEGYGWLGYLYMQKGLTPLALDYFVKSWRVREEIGDKDGVANALNNIGYIYDSQKEYELALEHYEKALAIRTELGNEVGMASILNNIGYIFDIQGDTSSALVYYEKSLKLRTRLEDKRGMAESFHNLAALYRTNGQLNKALDFYFKAFTAQIEISDIAGEINSGAGIAQVYLLQKKYKQAEEFALKSMSKSKKIGYPSLLESVSSVLKNIYKATGNYEKALKYHEIEISARDSVNNEKNQKSIIRQQTQYEFEKEQLIEEQKSKEEARIISEEINRRNNLQYSGIFVFVLIMFVFVLLSGKFSMSTKVAEGLIFFTFLLLFEFCLVLLDPFIDNWSSGEPLYKLLFNAMLAAGIFPLHAFFEGTLKKRLMKNEV
ncbi:MAG: tetratricopeptide repeat protein [Flavobacteriales bacterium]|nr:tetratricopeptide repeat protein [Flavobacteriales bacterium]